MPRAGLAAGDQPVDPVEVEALERAEQWLGADEAHGGRHVAQAVGAMHEAAVLDR